jgi:hypothetical protein
MSLINEALKKARQAQVQPVAQTAATPALRPVDPARHADNGGGLWLPILIAVTLITSGALLWQWFASGRVETVRARSTPAAAVPVPASVPLPASPTVATAPTPAPPSRPIQIPPIAPDAKQDSTNAVVATPEPPPATNAVVVAEVPKAPVYKLQGIFYRPKNPSAVIDGKLVFAGSRVSNAHVLLIEKDAVTIVTSEGQTNLLELP